jgi:hypothetical protein
VKLQRLLTKTYTAAFTFMSCPQFIYFTCPLHEVLSCDDTALALAVEPKAVAMATTGVLIIFPAQHAIGGILTLPRVNLELRRKV